MTTSEVTTTTTPTAERLAPGVTRDGVTNASALVDAHVAALNASGYAARTRVAVTVRLSENETFESESDTTVRATPGLTPYHLRTVHVETDGDARHRTVRAEWSNETTRLLRVESGNRTVHERLDPAGPGGSFERKQRLTHALTLRDVLARGDYEVKEVTAVNGSTRVTLVAERARDDAGNVTVFSATAVVDGDGRVHRLDATTTWPVRDREQTTTISYRLHQVGVVRVERPEWVVDALEAENETR